MKSYSTLVAVSVSLLLHAAVLLGLIQGTSDQVNVPVVPPPVTVELVRTSTVPMPLPDFTTVARAHSSPAKIHKETVKSGAKLVPKLTAASEPPAAPREVKADGAPVLSTVPATPQPIISPPVAKTPVFISAGYASSNRMPRQPEISIRYGEQGTVTLRVFVKSDGTAGPVEVQSSSGFPMLDESAKAAVQNWRFNPATIDAKPVAEWYQVPVVFKLR